MPAHTDNVTRVYFVDYTNAVSPHTVEFRALVTVTPPDFVTWWNTFIGHASGLFCTSTLVAMRLKLPTNTFSTPIDSSAATASWGSGTPNDEIDARYVGMAGRGDDGVRVSWRMFGYTFGDPNHNFRVFPGDDTAIANTIVDVQTAPDIGVTITGSAAHWGSYMNWAYSAYWQRKHR